MSCSLKFLVGLPLGLTEWLSMLLAALSGVSTMHLEHRKVNSLRVSFLLLRGCPFVGPFRLIALFRLEAGILVCRC